MRISAINSTYQRKMSQPAKTHRFQQVEDITQGVSPSFKGDVGRGVGAVLGALAGVAACAAAAAVSIAVPIAPAIIAGVAAKMGADAGHKIEEENKNKDNKKI